jgi:hypothetical protein
VHVCWAGNTIVWLENVICCSRRIALLFFSIGSIQFFHCVCLSMGERGSTNCCVIAQLDSSAAQLAAPKRIGDRSSGICYFWVILSLFSSLLGIPFSLISLWRWSVKIH